MEKTVAAMLRIGKKRIRYVLLAIALFALGGCMGWFLPHPAPATISIREPDAMYPLIDPLLYATLPESASYPQFASLKTDLTAYTAAVEEKGNANDISIYYRDLDSNRWVSVNTDHTFALASMLKVVTAVAALRAGEDDPSLLQKRITLAPDIPLTAAQQAYMPPAHPLQVGTSYSVSDLLSHQLIESDNDAERVLEYMVGLPQLKQTFATLDIPVPDNSSIDDIDTAQDYSRIFRVLYNATYLSRADSQSILHFLSESTYMDGLVSGVPAGTTVAHKFGEGLAGGGAVELHDCGIVYYPGHPYFICVLTRGADYHTLASVIRDASALTWKDASKVYSTH